MKLMQLTKSQEQAIKARSGNYLVSASAGSGKTAVLTERVFEVIKEGTGLDELLVLTFTNKAAAEMRDRIRQKLISTNDKDLFKVASNLDAANIQTFDAFALGIVKKYYYLLGLPKDINIVDKTVLAIEERKLLDKIFESHFDKNDENVLKLIHDYCLRSNDNLKDFIQEVSHKFDLKEDKKSFIKDYVLNFYKKERVDEILDGFVETCLTSINKMIDRVKKFYNTDYVDAVLPILERIASNTTYESLRNALTSENNKLPRSVGKLSLNDYPDDASYHKYISKTLKNFVELLKFETKDEYWTQFEWTKNHVSTILTLVSELDEELNKFKAKYAVYTYSDISKFATKIVSIPEINDDLKNRYRYIMIDEYQDTSDSQEKFINLIAKDNVYVVGDVKQSIYRFRNANCDLFLDKYNRYGSGEGGTRIELPDNFRSRKEVVDLVNKVFSPLMTKEKTGLDYAKDHMMIHGNKSYISANSQYFSEIIEYEPSDLYIQEEHQARLIATDILKKYEDGFEVFDKDLGGLRKIEFRDFAIILYAKKSFPIYQKVFNEFQIPLYADYDKSIRENNLTMVLINIIKLIDLYNEQDFSKVFRHAFISLLRSFLFEEDDQDIENLAYDEDYSKFKLYEILNKTVEESKGLSLKNLVSLIIKNFDIYNKIISIGDVSKNNALLDYYFNIAKQMDEMGYSIKEFRQYFDDLKEFEIDPEYSPTDDVNECVKLLTIHASKGLQFKVCYFAELTKPFNNQSLRNHFLVDDTFGIDIPNVYHKDISTIFHTSIVKKEKLETLKEQLRVFYVALTRAEEKIIMVAKKNYRKEPIQSFEQANEFYDFVALSDANLPVAEGAVSSKRRAFIENSDEIGRIEVRKAPELSSEVIVNRHASKELDADVDNELLLLGNKYHYYLELVNFSTKDTSFIKDKKDKVRIDKLLENSLFDKANEAKVMHEYPFVDTKNNVIGVIDLLLVYSDHIDIVDFKLSNVDDEKYEKQLGVYKDYVSQLSNKEINTYVLGILSNKLKKLS